MSRRRVVLLVRMRRHRRTTHFPYTTLFRSIKTSEQGTILLNLPGMIQIGEQRNVMVMAFDLGALKNISIKLMFVEPDQYKPEGKSE